MPSKWALPTGAPDFARLRPCALWSRAPPGAPQSLAPAASPSFTFPGSPESLCFVQRDAPASCAGNRPGDPSQTADTPRGLPLHPARLPPEALCSVVGRVLKWSQELPHPWGVAGTGWVLPWLGHVVGQKCEGEAPPGSHDVHAQQEIGGSELALKGTAA